MRALGWAFAVVTLLVFPASAAAGWSSPRSVSAPGAGSPALAVNAHGQSAIAWAPWYGTPTGPRYGTFVTVVVRTAGGSLRTHRVWSSSDSLVSGVSVSIDDHGVATAAWASSTRAQELHGVATVRAAYGALTGRWAPARVIGHSTSFGSLPAGRYPHLAVAPNGRELLAWDDDRAPKATVLAAWREPGHHFGAARVVGRSPNVPLGAIPAFDTHGRVYLSSPCYGLVMSAPPGRYRFGPPLLVAPGQAPHQALQFSLSLSDAGAGLASWVNGTCTNDPAAGSTPGPVYASVLRAYHFGDPIALTAAEDQSYGSTAVASAAGGGIVSWSDNTYRIPFLGGFFDGVSSAPIDPAGILGPVQQVPSTIVPVLRDGGGDQILTPYVAWPGEGGVILRPVDGSADQPAPNGIGWLAATSPIGRAAALAWNTNPAGNGPTLAISVWRP